MTLVVGNWKMNGTQHECQQLARKIAEELPTNTGSLEVAVAPPELTLRQLRRMVYG